MPRTARPYARVYYVDLQRDYPQVWFDPTALGTWLRMLVLADQAWPTMPELPRALRRADLEILTGCGLVILEPNHRYRIKGYELERTQRQAHAQAAAAGRWNGHDEDSAGNARRSPRGTPPGNAPSNAQVMPRPNPSTETESKAQRDRQQRSREEHGSFELAASFSPSGARA